MNKKFKNALYINFTNLFFSEAMKLIIIITFLISTAFSFWPWIYINVLGKEKGYTFENGYFMVLGICTVFVIFIVMIITRIGAQVGFEKGSKATEIILTSISKHQLYQAHVLSSIVVVFLAFIIVSIPLCIAGFIKKPDVALYIVGVSQKNLLFIVAHALGTTIILIILAIAVTSIVKKSEDTGPYLLMILIPFLLSNIFFIIKGDIYRGSLSFFNYLPICSLIPAIGTSLLGTIYGLIKVFIIISDVVWMAIIYSVGKKCFEKNISI